MSSERVPAPFIGFTRLGTSSYIYEPKISPTTPSSHTTSGPDTILLLPWLSAAPKHIAKYTTGYQRLFPRSRILLLTTSLPDVTYASPSFPFSSSGNERLNPVIDILVALSKDEKILVASFSNGGAWTACLIARAVRERTGKALGMEAMILDSSPGRPRYRRTIIAMSQSLPKSLVLYYASLFVLHIFMLSYVLVTKIGGGKVMVQELWEDSNDKRLFNVNSKRCYIYSKEDEMVDWRDVEEHADVAEARGWVVRREMWEGTPHCGHLKREEGRYWAVVRGVWDEV